VNKNGKFIGTNTDAYGFITNLRGGLGELGPYLNHVVIIGAGGATRAAIAALQQAGAKKITLVNRTVENAQVLAKEFSVDTAAWDARNGVIAHASLLVNTTSLGMVGHPPLELDLEQLPPTAAVHDIVYAPLETALLDEARQRGHRVVDGLGMLLYQAQLAFQEWHGVLPEVTAALRAHVLTPDDEHIA
jgi:shikimate dehydrogenase